METTKLDLITLSIVNKLIGDYEIGPNRICLKDTELTIIKGINYYLDEFVATITKKYNSVYVDEVEYVNITCIDIDSDNLFNLTEIELNYICEELKQYNIN